MAHKKGVGSTDNGRDSKSKRLGVKLFGGQHALAGNIIVRQRGTKYHPGLNVYLGKDHTIHARIDGVVTFRKGRNDRSIVSIMPLDAVSVAAPAPVKKAPTAKPAPKPAAEPVVLETVAPAPPVVEAVETAPVVEAAIETVTEVVEAPVAEVAPAVEEVAIETPAVEAAIEAAEVAIETPAVEAAIEAAEEAVEVVEEVAAAVEEATEAPAETAAKPAKTPKLDDLKVIEGIGPKIEQLFKEAGIDTWAKLAEAPVTRLQEILDEAGPRYQVHNPSTWPAQAKFCVEGRWEELKEYQDMLIGGRDLSE